MIYFASDHGGYKLKERLFMRLSNEGYSTYDLGCAGTQISCDYPLFAQRCANAMSEEGEGFDPNSFGVLLCGTGIGISMAANRYTHIRAALCLNLTYARLAREHNNANVLCLPGRFMEFEDAHAILHTFLTTQPAKEARHARRLEMMNAIN
tara:strand:- start:342 stop:794 length:453 start_codon:yes stop_codon:yes gene_type:complete